VAAAAPVAPVPAGKTKDPSEPASPAAAAPAATAAAGVRCPTCGTANPPMYRFCVTCGVTLPKEARSAAEPPAAEAPAPGRASHVAAPTPVVPVHPPPAHAGRLEERIIGAPVVEIASGAVAQKPIICPRCGGQCIPTARFCQFCGAPFAGAAAAPATAAAPRPSDDEVRAPATVREPPPAPQAPRAIAAQTASPQPRGRLIVIEADGSEGMTFPMFDRPLDVGRTEGDILVKEDPYVSPRHARLVPDGARWLLRDLASTNGIYIRIKKPYLLQDADLLLLGQEVLQFQLVSEPEKGLGHASQHGTLLFGSPITSRSARLCQRTVEGVVRDVYHLHRDETVVGRETGDIVFTADPFLSRRHAMIRRALARKEGGGRSGSRWDFTLTDLDSSNGTFVAIRQEVVLQHGDFVRVGQHLFRVDLA